MSERSRNGAALALALVGTAAAVPGASADCLRRVHNRSSLVLVASQDGGPAVTLPPGRAMTVRFARPGRLDFAAYCGLPGAGAAPVARESFAYEAVLDRCFIRFGSQLYAPQLGRGFFGTQGTAPFTLNNPRQGDVVLGPVRAPGCAVPGAVLSRGG